MKHCRLVFLWSILIFNTNALPLGLLRTTGLAVSGRETFLRHKPEAISWASWEKQREDPAGNITGQAEEVWDESTKLPTEVEAVVAFIWVLILLGVPWLLRYLDGRKRTHTQTIIGVVFVIAVLGGMLLFTNVVKFNSGHFMQTRTLTIVECIYLMSQVITTVGYGDITPAYPRGQVFVAIYVLASLLVIAMLVSDLVDHVMNAAKKYREKLASEQKELSSARERAKMPQSRRRSCAALSILQNASPPSSEPLAAAFFVFTFFAFTWVLFFHFYPGEHKTWLQAIYMSVITLSTVGFGAVTPNTEAGKVFASFWMIFGSVALVSVVTQFTELMLKLQEYERYDPADATKAFKEFADQHHSDAMNEVDFLKFALVQNNIATLGDLNELSDAYTAVYKDLKSADHDHHVEALQKDLET